MSGSLEILDVINAQGQIVHTAVFSEIVSGTSAVGGVVAIASGGSLVGPSVALPVADSSVLSELVNLGTVLSHGSSLSYTLNTQQSVGIASTPLTLAVSVTNELILTTCGPGDVWVNPVAGGTAVVNQGLCVPGGGGAVEFGKNGYPLPTGTISAIVNAGTSQFLAMAGG